MCVPGTQRSVPRACGVGTGNAWPGTASIPRESLLDRVLGEWVSDLEPEVGGWDQGACTSAKEGWGSGMALWGKCQDGQPSVTISVLPAIFKTLESSIQGLRIM